MNITKKFLLTGAALMAFAIPNAAQAEVKTVKTQTIIQQKDLKDVRKTNFSAFDMNEDGTLSMKEVGTKLFYVFDTDGNEVIDNNEYDHKQIMTIIPMEKNTYKYVDYDSDGDTDQAVVTYETFFAKSGLMKFDKNMDGLSASEFVDTPFLKMDFDKSGMIEIDEWKEAYTASNSPENAKQEGYQQ